MKALSYGLILVVASLATRVVSAKPLTIVTAGDAFMVQRFPKGYSIAPELAGWIGSGDARLVNFEAVVNDGSCPPAAQSGGTWAVMRPEVLDDLLAFGFNGCGTANNHSTDYSAEGLRMTKRALKARGIANAGTGEDLAEASAPAFIETPNGRVAVVSVSASFNADGRAGLKTSRSPGRPGLNALRHKEKYFVTKEHFAAIREVAGGTGINGQRALNQQDGFTLPDAPGTYVLGGLSFEEAEKEGKTSWCNTNDLKRITAAIASAKREAAAVVVLAHSHDIRGTRYCEPAKYFEEFCRAAVDAGADAVIGGGTHELKGVEFRKGRPIFYSLGDFVFQNNVTPSVPPDFCEQYSVPLDSDAKTALAARSKGGKVGLHTHRANFLSVLPKVEVEGGEVKRVTLMPIELHFGQDWSVNGLPRPASPQDAADIAKTLSDLSAEYGTEIVRREDGLLEARPIPPPAQVVDRALLKELLEIPSEAGRPKDLLRAVDLVKSWLEARGVFCAVETNSVGLAGLYAATTPGKVHDYLFVSHVDIVPAPPEMYSLRTDGDRFFARGACDTKGNVAAVCHVLASLVGKASVGMFLATDEEGGGKGEGTPQMMIDRGYVPRKLILVADTAGEEPGQLFTAEKGHAHIDLVATGKGGHSSRPWALDNPVPRLCDGYLKFKAAWDKRLVPGERWQTVVSPTKLYGSDANNIVADEVSMHFSCRYITMADYEKVLEVMKETSGLEVRCKGPGRRPVENRPNDPEIAALLKAMNAGIRGGVREGKMSAATDASYYATLGVPIVIWTAVGGEPHSVREWGSFSSLDEYAAFFVRYLTAAL